MMCHRLTLKQVVSALPGLHDARVLEETLRGEAAENLPVSARPLPLHPHQDHGRLVLHLHEGLGRLVQGLHQNDGHHHHRRRHRHCRHHHHHHHHHHRHHHLFLNRLFHYQFPPCSPVLHCPLGLGELQACTFPDVVFPPLLLSALSSSPFHCALQDGFGQTL